MKTVLLFSDLGYKTAVQYDMSWRQKSGEERIMNGSHNSLCKAAGEKMQKTGAGSTAARCPAAIACAAEAPEGMPV